MKTRSRQKHGNMKTSLRLCLCAAEAVIILFASSCSYVPVYTVHKYRGDPDTDTVAATDTMPSDSVTAKATGSTQGTVTVHEEETVMSTGKTETETVSETVPETVPETTAPKTTETVRHEETAKPVETAAEQLKSIVNLTFSVGPAGGDLYYAAPSDGVLYLSSAADVTKLRVRFDGNGYLKYHKTNAVGGKKVFSGDTVDLSGMQGTERHSFSCWFVTFSAGSESVDLIVLRGSVSSMFIQTSAGLSRLHASKENRDANTRAIYVNKAGKIEYNDVSAETVSEFKCRGNSSFNDFDKKPYQLKLGKKTGLAGMKKAKTWILLTGAYDKSFLRNAAAISIANALKIPYTQGFEYVDLFVDGEYKGLYILTEKVQIGNNRIEITSLEDANEEINSGKDLSKFSNYSATSKRPWLSTVRFTDIPKQPADITGGYLVELDNLYSNADPSVFITKSNNHYVVKSPEYASFAEVDYIGGLIAEMEEALYSPTGYNSYGRHYSEYIDVNSLADVYLVREIMKDWDGFNGSTYFYKDADVNGITSELHLGPIWDFDLCLNNNDVGNYRPSVLWCQSEGEPEGSSRQFGKYLMSHPEMKALVASHYSVAANTAISICENGGYLDELKKSVFRSYTMERNRWASRGYSRVFTNGTDADETTYTGEVKFRLSERAKLLESYIGKYKMESGYYSVTLSPELEGKVKLCSAYFAVGSRASVRCLADPDISLVAVLPDGGTVKLQKSSTASQYDGGIQVFTMPKANVVIRAGN